MDKAIAELIDDLEREVRRYQKRCAEYEIVAEDCKKKIHYLENKIRKIKEEVKC